ncbi:endonuclease G [Diaminobutyricimonas aerilata]|uniref:Endonuclease G n=1 Tax=Diaminobutyricimonas aerilata TaxID=1162967 RepID=A0A2M9CMF9_9MICO|nr:DNA/RNA non-specific endonuclease [Diaminobutyricimonas aerilata]PJJ73058.1 endonuclease G [Diaminobutyricimonas aerilata]
MGDVGYDSGFLGLDVRLPWHPLVPLVTLDYTHFTVGMNTARRLAAFTAVNIDGRSLVELERGDDWHLDERLPEDQQAGEELYARNDLDRGHLVRRRDPVWGDRDTAERANTDTFAYTNAAPQAAEFNQSKELWLGLEDYVLSAARASRSRLSVFTGPVLAVDDEEYRGVRIPRQFWKVAAWVEDGVLASTGYVLDQSPALDDVDLGARPGSPSLGPFRTFQVPVADVVALTALDLGTLPEADRFAPGATAQVTEWRELTVFGQIEL